MTDKINQTLTLTLQKDVTLKADWKGFVASTAEAVINFFTKGPPDGLSGAISSLVKLVSSIEVTPSPGQRIWVLTASSFGWALDQVRPETDVTHQAFNTALRKALAKASEVLDNGEIEVSKDYLDRPTNIEIYRILMSEFLSNLSSLEVIDKSDLQWRLNSAYSRGIFEVWSRKHEYYRPLADLFSNGPSDVADFEINWKAYRAQLISDFEVKPVFGQEDSRISLSKLYVPLRCVWRIEDTSRELSIDSTHFSDDIENGLEIGLLEDELSRWVIAPRSSDWLRIIGGGPGSGKSTTLKSLCRKLAERADIRPLLIPLQHIDLKKDLRDAINQYYVDTSGSAFSQPPLARAAVEDGPPLVLIFDGLDEIAAPGEAAKDVVGDFANRLATLVASLDGAAQAKVKVIVSGRMPAFQAARRYLTPKPHGALEVIGFLPARSGKQQNQLWNQDQRPQWWTQFAAQKGLPTEIPPAFVTERLEGITHEPLLCYLLALADYATEHWEEAADNRNRIYSALVNSIYDRGWGDGIAKRQGAGKTLTRDDFNKLMETIALAAWLGGDSRIASESMFEQAVEITGASSAWKTFTDDNGDDVTNLAMNFYLKSSEKSERGFEFTHKSFGEYLASRAILSAAEEVAEYFIRKPDHALQDWYKSTKSGEFDPDIHSFCMDEARLIALAPEGIIRLTKLKNTFQSIALRVAEDGFPLSSDGSSARKIEMEQMSAECGVWVIINSCARAIAQYGKLGDAYINMGWGEKDAWSNLLKRLGSKPIGIIIFRCMSYIIAEENEFNELVAVKSNFDGAILDGSLFARVEMHRGWLRGASLSNVRFYESKLYNVDFDSSDLENVVFHMTPVRGCSFDAVKTSFLTFSPGSFIMTSPSQVKKIDCPIRLLVSNDHSKDEIINFLRERIDQMNSLVEHENANLIEDWAMTGPDFETHYT